MEFHKQLELENKLSEKHLSYWLEYVLWSPLWWFGIVCVVLSIFLLYKYLDRKRVIPIIICGITSLQMTTSLDAFGIFVPLWTYPYPTTPLYEPLFAVDFLLIPVPCMLLYQKYTRWKPFLGGTISLSLLFAFGFEPLADWLNLYKLEAWHYYYSVPLYGSIFILTKYFADTIERIHLRNL